MTIGDSTRENPTGVPPNGAPSNGALARAARPNQDARHRRVYPSLQLKEAAWIGIPAAFLVFGAFWLAYQFVEPAPPRAITIATGAKTGAYFAFAERYKAHLARDGITMNVRETKGSVENLSLLKDASSGVSVALVQGGIAEPATKSGVVSLGRVFPEPLWVFYTGSDVFDRLAQLSGKRIAIGAPGSGTRRLAEALLATNDITAGSATFLDVGGMDAATALAAGDADAIFLTAAPSAPLIKALLADTQIKLMSFSQGEAYTRLFPYLVRVTLPAGVMNLVKNIPAEDVTLIAPTAALVARDDLHPAVIGLLVEAVKDVHGGGGMFQRIDEFPKPKDPEFAMSEDAVRLYEQGQPWLQSFLPFWLAIFFERMFIMIVPIATILLPLLKIGPMLYDWRLRRRILYWYAQLKGIERELQDEKSADELGDYLDDMDRIDTAVAAIPMPLHYSDRFYEMRAAVDLVRQRIAVRYDTLSGQSRPDRKSSARGSAAVSAPPQAYAPTGEPTSAPSLAGRDAAE